MTSGRSAGVVRRWSPHLGWGVVDSADTPGGCVVRLPAVGSRAAQQLRAGQPVDLEWESATEEGFAFRARRVSLRDDLETTPGA
jgi:cold shock protein